MELKNIKTTCCPVCGETTVIGESVEVSRYGKAEVRQHTNGGKWEKRTFLCGYSVTYCPNFSKDEKVDYTQCANDMSIKNRNLKRKLAHDKVMSFVDSLTDVDDDFKNSMTYEVDSLKYKFK